MKLILILTFILSLRAYGKEIITNEVQMPDAPAWLKQTRIEKVTDRIQHHLDWSTHRVAVYWHKTQDDFDRVQHFGAQSVAITKYSNDKATIHLGPRVDTKNFDEVFGHELVHVIAFQKYKGVIPKWLEEGIANYFSRYDKVDYKWLDRQPPIADVHQLAHPFSGSPAEVTYRYKASQAFAEMLAKKCNLEVLIGMSSENKMEDYMRTYCELKDLTGAFHSWVKKKAHE